MYNKLFTKILDSSIWLESAPTRIVWLTFIAAMDEAGFVQFAGVGNVAVRARVTLEEAREAIQCLEAADAESSNPDNNGRRIERVPGGWMVLNASTHREMVTRAVAQEQNRERVRKHREKMKRSCNDPVMQSEALSGSGSEAEVQQLATLAVTPPQATRPKPLTYRSRIDVAWPGRPPVPGNLHAEFRAKLGGDPETAEARLNAWYPIAAAVFEDQPIGDDDYRFWRARFREWIGTTEKPVRASKSAAPTPVYADEDWCQHEPRCGSRDWHAIKVQGEQEGSV